MPQAVERLSERVSSLRCGIFTDRAGADERVHRFRRPEPLAPEDQAVALLVTDIPEALRRPRREQPEPPGRPGEARNASQSAWWRTSSWCQ
jgi:hypothetical protein